MSKLEGVKQVTVDVDKKNATVTLEDKASLSKEAVVKALNGSKNNFRGRYKVTSFETK